MQQQQQFNILNNQSSQRNNFNSNFYNSQAYSQAPNQIQNQSAIVNNNNVSVVMNQGNVASSTTVKRGVESFTNCMF
jgi:hypothetical protein